MDSSRPEGNTGAGKKGILSVILTDNWREQSDTLAPRDQVLLSWLKETNDNGAD